MKCAINDPVKSFVFFSAPDDEPNDQCYEIFGAFGQKRLDLAIKDSVTNKNLEKVSGRLQKEQAKEGISSVQPV